MGRQWVIIMPTKYDVIFIDDVVTLTDIFQQYIIWNYNDWSFLTFNNSSLAHSAIINNRITAAVWIIDMMMPQKNGADLAKAIRSQSGDMPILLAYSALDRRALESNDSYRDGMPHFNQIINKKEDLSSILSLVDVFIKEAK